MVLGPSLIERSLPGVSGAHLSPDRTSYIKVCESGFVSRVC
jgi:hypothetical protein